MQLKLHFGLLVTEELIDNSRKADIMYCQWRA